MSRGHSGQRSPLRVGLVGAGWVTQHHLAGWHQCRDRASVVAIADPDRRQAELRAREYGIKSVFDSAKRMLDDIELDALDIAAPRQFHAQLVRLAADRGLAVLCQKPLAPSFSEAQTLAGEVASRCRLMVHENWRFRPHYRALSQWLGEGRIGEVVQAQMNLLTSGLIADAEGQLPALVRQPFLAGLDRALVMEILIHHIDTLRFLLGDLRLMHARIGHGSAAVLGEDRAFACFETAAGAPVALMANLAVHGRAPAAPDRLTLIGTRGTIELAGDVLRCAGEQPCELRFDMAAGYLQSYASTIAHFIDGLQDGRDFETAPTDNLRTLGLVEAIYASGGTRVEDR